MITTVAQYLSLTIAVGAVNSNAITAKGGVNGGTMVYGKTVTDGVLTYKYQVSANNIDWMDLVDSAAAAVIPPLEGKAKMLNDVAAFVRIVASGAVTAVPKVWHISAEI